MADIISIGTAVPQYRFDQKNMIRFVDRVYTLDPTERRKLSFMYLQSDISTRYTVVQDYGQEDEQLWNFLHRDEEGNIIVPSIDKRMELYNKEALPLSLASINDCISGYLDKKDITHLITVSCTGMSAPGLDLDIAQAMQLSPEIVRTSVNFMGCYAAVHALKMAKYICDSETTANVLIVTTELCSLHFQKEFTPDFAAGSLLFSDGSAAVLVSNQLASPKGLRVQDFYSKVLYNGAADMAWTLSTTGFLIALSSYVPDLIEQNVSIVADAALAKYKISKEQITHWCIHPGGKKILSAVSDQLSLDKSQMCYSKDVLLNYGNMSSPSILFVLKKIMDAMQPGEPAKIFGLAMGPGLTVESFYACTNEL